MVHCLWFNTIVEIDLYWALCFETDSTSTRFLSSQLRCIVLWNYFWAFLVSLPIERIHHANFCCCARVGIRTIFVLLFRWQDSKSCHELQPKNYDSGWPITGLHHLFKVRDILSNQRLGLWLVPSCYFGSWFCADQLTIFQLAKNNSSPKLYSASVAGMVISGIE